MVKIHLYNHNLTVELSELLCDRGQVNGQNPLV